MPTRAQTRAYNANARRANRLLGQGSERLISIETLSEVEKYTLGTNAERLTDYNEAVEQWLRQVTADLRTSAAQYSSRVSKELKPKAYKDRQYGMIDRIGFSFPRHGIYIHHGAGRGYGGFQGSKWEVLKREGNTLVGTGIMKTTDPKSLGKMGTGKRKPHDWFNHVIEQHIPELEKIVTSYFTTMVVDATRIYI